MQLTQKIFLLVCILIPNYCLADGEVVIVLFIAPVAIPIILIIIFFLIKSSIGDQKYKKEEGKRGF